ncbi:MAG: YIP1 family protein [Acidobacteriota bacterium]
MASYAGRMVGAARLDVHTFEEVEADRGAMGQAIGVIVLSSVAAAIGMTSGDALSFIIGIAGALLGWMLWAWLTYFVGTRVLPEPQTHADWGQVLRTTGFAAAPGILRIFGVIPAVAGIIFIVTGIWMLIAMIIAIRQALDYTSSLRAVGVAGIGWVVYIVVATLLFFVTGGGQ